MRFGDGMSGWGMGWLGFFGALLLVGLVVLIVLLVRILGGGVRREGSASRGGAGSPPQPGTGSARQILAERYARGEIDTEEYQTRLRTLEGS